MSRIDPVNMASDSHVCFSPQLRKPRTKSAGRTLMAVALELLGARDVRNYYRSWSEWRNSSETPVVKPEPKKK